MVSIGGRVSFIDLTLGDPEQWDWTFNGASPQQYSGQYPTGITYSQYGEYGVRLKVYDPDVSDEIYKDKYIRVTPIIYPNPAHDYVVMDFGRRPLSFIEVTIYDMIGKKVQEYSVTDVNDGIWQIQLDDISAGRYILNIKTDVMEDNMSLVVY